MKKIILFSLCAVACLLLRATVFAQEADSVENTPDAESASMAAADDDQITEAGETVIVANVDFRDPTILSLYNHDITVSFTLSNGNLSQSNVRYSVMAVERDAEGYNMPVDEYVYDEAVNLNSHESIERKVVYTVPTYLKGTYGIMLQARNEAGLPLAIGDAGNIELAGDGKYVAIVDCTLYAESDKERTFFPGQGLDIAPEDNLIAKCAIENKLQQDMTLTPYFETRSRSDFGPMITDVPTRGEEFTVTNAEKKEVEIRLPKTVVPQSYNIKVAFLSPEGYIVSNSVPFHYVIRGESATIQNVSIDKSYYKKGDQAKIMLFWSKSADDFPGSLAQDKKTATRYMLAITDAQGENCINPITNTLEGDDLFINLTEEVIKECINPKVSARVVNDQGTSLGTLDYHLVSEKQEKEQKGLFGYEDITTLVIWFIVILFLISCGVIIAIVRKNRKGVSVLIFALMAGSLFALHDHPVYAVTASNRFLSATANINKNSYNPGENISTSAFVTGTHCGNYWYDGTYYGGVGSASSNMGSFRIKSASNYVANFSMNSTAPSSPGNYNMVYQVNAVQTCTSTSSTQDDCTRKTNNIGPMYIPFSVVQPAVIPSCTISYSPTSLIVGNTGSVRITIANDANGQVTCSCSGLDSPSGSFSIGAGVYAQGPFYVTGTKTCNCTAQSGTGHTATCSGSMTSVAAPINGACGTRSTTYPSTTTAWPSGSTLCASGTASANPAFPVAGSSVSWMCVGANGGSSANCAASRAAAPINGACGTRSTTYPSTTTAWPSGSTLCALGTATTNPTFPTIGTTVNWICAGANGGGNANCSAAHATYACTGATPANATPCANGGTGLLADTARTLVAACTSGVKCEYTCNIGYYLSGGVCVPYACADVLPSNGTKCPNTDLNITSAASWHAVSACNSTQKCEFTVPIPTLTLTADPVTITEGESSTITWTTTNTTSCWAQDPTAPWQGWKTFSGSIQSVSPTTTTTYDMECWNAAGVSTGKKSVTITVEPQTYDCLNRDPECLSSSTVVCPGSMGGKTTDATKQWKNVGKKWQSCDPQGECECYTPAGTVPSGNENDDDQGEDGRLIETRP